MIFGRGKHTSLETRFMLITSGGVLALTLCMVGMVGWLETAKVESKLHDFSANELASLNTLVLSVMEARRSDVHSEASEVFDRWFEQRNKEYPGQLWRVWAPKVAAYVAEKMPDKPAQRPRDAIDEEAFNTRQPVGRMVDGAYRFSIPIVLGVTRGTDQLICQGCHTALMKQDKGEVIGVFSSSVSAQADFAALRRQLAIMGGVALACAVGLVLAIRFTFAGVITRRLRQMTAAMLRLTKGDTEVEIQGQARTDEIGDM
ncbi:MAG: HAMP domain-containing protein, partial [Nevskiales bacterium]